MNKIKAINYLNIFDHAGRLKQIQRYGWLLKGIKKPESVADHISRVVLMTLILGTNTALDLHKMVSMAIIHDLGESIVGDVIYESGTKIIGSLKNKHRDERHAMKVIFEKILEKKKYLSLWEEWVKQKTPESQFVKRVEKLEMVMQALEYETLGYSSKLFDEFWENTWKYLKDSDLEPLYQELENRRAALLKNKSHL